MMLLAEYFWLILTHDIQTFFVLNAQIKKKKAHEYKKMFDKTNQK